MAGILENERIFEFGELGTLLWDPSVPEAGSELTDLDTILPPARPPADGGADAHHQHRAEDEAGDSLHHRGSSHKGADVAAAAIPSAPQNRGHRASGGIGEW